MLAYMNAEALARTIETGEAHYWSRSRSRLWRKGETAAITSASSSCALTATRMRCWLKIEMAGAEACCHTGRKSCFYRAVPMGEPIGGRRLPSPRRYREARSIPETVYGHARAAKGTLKT